MTDDPNKRLEDSEKYPRDELKKALKAFRKKIRRMQADDESRLSHGAMTKGYTSSIVGIRPPGEFPVSIWDELAKQGKLKPEGNGTYSLIGPAG